MTQNGRAAAVLLSPIEFDALAERARFLQAVAEGMADEDKGRLTDHEAAPGPRQDPAGGIPDR